MYKKADLAEIEEMRQLLTTTPHRLTTLSAGVDPARLNFKSTRESWSANDILAHLRACADVWGKSMLMMLAQDHPTLNYVSPRTWIRKTNYPQQEFHLSLQAFNEQRAELLSNLNALNPDDWLRGATFIINSKGREETVLSYARRMALHENGHCAQIEALIKE